MKTEKHVNAILMLTLIIALVCSTSSITYVYAVSPSTSTIIEAGSMTMQENYLVFTDGTNYFCRNGSTGEICFNDTDAEDLIDLVFGAADDGDAVFLGAGTFEIDDTLILDKEITFAGAGYGKTVIEMQSGGNGENVLNITDSAIVRDLTLDGNDYGQDGVSVQVANVQLRFIEVMDCTRDGIVLGSGVLGGRVIDFRISNVDRYGIYMEGTDFEIHTGLIRSSVAGNTDAGICTIAGGGTHYIQVHIWGCKYGVQIGETGDRATRNWFSECAINDNSEHGVNFAGASGGGYDTSFDHCEFKENGDSAAGTYDAIHVDSGATFQRVCISNCEFMGQRGATNYTRYVLNCEGTGESRLVFVGNVIHDGTFTGSPNLIQSVSTAPAYMNVIEANTGYITEWTEDDIFPSGNSSYAFEHNVVGTPVYVGITWREAPHTASVGLLYFVTRNATHFIVYLIDANDGTTQAADEDMIFMWYARYELP